jgi:FMN reductase [NAD(P)H]
MNQTIELLKNHRSHRKFDTSYELSAEDRQAIIDCARQASTWMNGQFYSIVVVDDPELRRQIIEAGNQNNAFIADASLVLLFVADLSRQANIVEHAGAEFHGGDSVESLLIAAGDAMLALQNAMVAAESLGLGGVVVGGVRRVKAIGPVTELLGLPKYSVPMSILAIGKPLDDPAVKPRLPESAVVHVNHYEPATPEVIAQYDSVMIDSRIGGHSWSQRFVDYPLLTEPGPKWTDDYLKSQGFLG